jgi:hypothetical protein
MKFIFIAVELLLELNTQGYVLCLIERAWIVEILVIILKKCLHYRFCVSWIILCAYLFGWHRFGDHILSFCFYFPYKLNLLVGTNYYLFTPY